MDQILRMGAVEVEEVVAMGVLAAPVGVVMAPMEAIRYPSLPLLYTTQYNDARYGHFTTPGTNFDTILLPLLRCPYLLS